MIRPKKHSAARLLHLGLGAALLEGLERLLALSLGLALEDGEGRLVAASFASLRPREVRERTTLMIAMRLEASTSVMTRSNSVFSAAASSPPPPGPAAMATPPRGRASTPKVSSIRRHELRRLEKLRAKAGGRRVGGEGQGRGRGSANERRVLIERRRDRPDEAGEVGARDRDPPAPGRCQRSETRVSGFRVLSRRAAGARAREPARASARLRTPRAARARAVARALVASRGAGCAVAQKGAGASRVRARRGTKPHGVRGCVSYREGLRFSIISSVAADMATTPVRREALGVKALDLSARTGAPYATWRGGSERGQRVFLRRRRFRRRCVREKPVAVARRETAAIAEAHLGGGLGGDGGLHAEGRGHGGHGRHGLRCSCWVSPTRR